MSKGQAIKTLMMIDDSELDQALYKRVIKRSGMVENIIAFNMATDALAYMKSEESEKIDVILLDINMPLMSGFEFLSKASEDLGSEFSASVVIMLTTSLNPADMARADEYNMVKAYLTKPLTIENLEHISDLLYH